MTEALSPARQKSKVVTHRSQVRMMEGAGLTFIQTFLLGGGGSRTR
jgi:hypothetical protein